MSERGWHYEKVTDSFTGRTQSVIVMDPAPKPPPPVNLGRWYPRMVRVSGRGDVVRYEVVQTWIPNTPEGRAWIKLVESKPTRKWKDGHPPFVDAGAPALTPEQSERVQWRLAAKRLDGYSEEHLRKAFVWGHGPAESPSAGDHNPAELRQLCPPSNTTPSLPPISPKRRDRERAKKRRQRARARGQA